LLLPLSVLVCHSAAQRRNLLLSLPLHFWRERRASALRKITHEKRALALGLPTPRVVILAQSFASPFWRSPSRRHSGEARISVLSFAFALAVACSRLSFRSAAEESASVLAVASSLPPHPPTPSSRPVRAARSGGIPAFRSCRCLPSSAPTNSAVILSGVAHGLIVSHAVEEPRHSSPSHNPPNHSPNALAVAVAVALVLACS
jgi:hypothetical protein